MDARGHDYHERVDSALLKGGGEEAERVHGSDRVREHQHNRAGVPEPGQEEGEVRARVQEHVRGRDQEHVCDRINTRGHDDQQDLDLPRHVPELELDHVRAREHRHARGSGSRSERGDAGEVVRGSQTERGRGQELELGHALVDKEDDHHHHDQNQNQRHPCSRVAETGL